MNSIRITPGDRRPIFRQVVDQVVMAIEEGQLQPGDALPSTRQLAQDLLINPNTIAKAYSTLVANGVVHSQRGRGYFVSEHRNVLSPEECDRRLNESIRELGHDGALWGFTPQQIVGRTRQQLLNGEQDSE